MLVAIICVGSASFVKREGSLLKLDGQTFRYGGPNIYWLGLDKNDPPEHVAYPTKYRVDDALRTAKGMGARVVRSHTLGISTGNPLSFEPALDVWNHHALESIDYAVHRAGELGLKLVVPLTDNYHYYHGGLHDFTDWYGLPVADFYTNETVVAAFKRYIFHLLNHTNRYNGKRYCEDDTVMAWETGNELFPPANWTADIAKFLKSIAPDQLVLSGRYGINIEELGIPEVDLFSDHFYPPWPLRLEADVFLTSSASKAFIAGEYAWTYNGSTHELLDVVLREVNVSGALYWVLFPHLDTYGFELPGTQLTMHYPSESSSRREAKRREQQQFAWNMRNETEQPFLVEVAPLLHHVNVSGDSATFAWRGAAGACWYNIVSDNSTVVKSNVTDDMLPVVVDGSSTHSTPYHVVPYSCSGVPGPPSNVVEVV